MKRNPSIHVTKTQLLDSLKKAVDQGIIPDDCLVSLVKHLFTHSKNYNANNRSILVSNNKIEQKVKNILSSSSNDCKTLAHLIYLMRIRMKHMGVQEIKATSRDWDSVKKVTANALEFCKVFNFDDKKSGFLKYLEIGNSKMAKFSLQKYLSMNEAIFTTHESNELIKHDKYPALTKDICNAYNSRILNITGIGTDYSKNPEKYVCFCKVALYCIEHKIHYKNYIESQFSGLGFKDSYPDPLQLIGDKAIDRLNRYLYERKIKVDVTPKSTANWQKILGDK